MQRRMALLMALLATSHKTQFLFEKSERNTRNRSRSPTSIWMSRRASFSRSSAPRAAESPRSSRFIAGLDEPTAGELLIKGRPGIGLEPRERDIAMAFQTYALYPHMTAAQNIALALRMRRMRRWAATAANILMRDIGISVARPPNALNLHQRHLLKSALRPR
jgi:hypothetical protein